VGLIVYYFFGRDYRKQRLFNLKGAIDGPVIERFWEDRQAEFAKRLDRTEK
jgi:cardiolipin synthase